MSQPERLVAVALSLVAAACAGAHRSDVAQALSPVDAARCSAVADSVSAHTSPASLAFATPRGRPHTPRPPDDAQPGVPLHTTFLVRPDGSADTATVVITGTTDQGYRAAMVRFLAGLAFRSPTVAGCPVWGRGDIQIIGVRRTVMVAP